jgi:tRNA 2-thiocytidine biosynthesis protein TtcA
MAKTKSKIHSNKLQQKLRRNVGRAIADFAMIEAGDKVMVCLSGGKDSYAMLELLLSLKRKAPVDFDLIAVNLDQKQPGFPERVLPRYLDGLGIEYHVVEQDTYSVVKRVVPEGKTMCGACSRFRRGILYSFASNHGVTKIALGHHRDDIIETLFLNMFFGSRLKAMPPKLLSDDGRNVVIRPLAYCREADIEAYAEARAYPIIPCQLCGRSRKCSPHGSGSSRGGWRTYFGACSRCHRLIWPTPSSLIFTRCQGAATQRKSVPTLGYSAGIERSPELVPPNCSLTARRRILPTFDFGSSSTNSM